MHMYEFHSKLTSTQEGDPMLEALRSMSRIEDPKALFNIDIDPIILGEWAQWPSMDAHASDATSKGV
jgi:hypothetical protein